MKHILYVFISFLSLVLGINTASGTPLDLTTFTADPVGVSVNYGTGAITFTEDINYQAIYFYNDTFLVDQNATILAFDYSLALGLNNDDYLVAVINYNNYFFELGASQTGSFQYDFSSLRGQTISLAFGLESSDHAADSTATISNLDMGISTVPIPEPGTLVLLSSGLVGLLGIGRKKLIGFFK